MSRDNSETLSEIEESQAALRKSIESARELSLESDRLIRLFRARRDPDSTD